MKLINNFIYFSIYWLYYNHSTLQGSKSMHSISPVLIQTWLFLIQSKDPKLAYAKLDAHRLIKQYFGSVDLAYLYLEQHDDHQIEVMVV